MTSGRYEFDLKLAGTISEAMAERFDASPEEFAVIQTEGDGEPSRLVVAFAAKYALPVDTTVNLGRLSMPGLGGDWESIYRPRSEEKYMVEVDGHRYDTRRGMTYATYKAMVKRAEAQGDEVPDEGVIFDLQHAIRTRAGTYLTGENPFYDPVEARAPIGRASKDYGPQKTSVTFNNRHAFVGFRPAVML